MPLETNDQALARDTPIAYAYRTRLYCPDCLTKSRDEDLCLAPVFDGLGLVCTDCDRPIQPPQNPFVCQRCRLVPPKHAGLCDACCDSIPTA